MKEMIEYNTAYEAVKVNGDEKRCYPCSGLGYHIETCIEADGSRNRVKITCACCDGSGESK